MNKRSVVGIGIGTFVLIALTGVGVGLMRSAPAGETATGKAAAPNPNVVTITASQARSLRVETVTVQAFTDEREAVGYIDFNQERTVPVSSPWAGRIDQVLVKTGDDVQKGQTLFIVDSPDLVQAESNLISAAGMLELANKALERAVKLAGVQGAAQRDVDQATADQRTAQSNHQAARNALRIFGKSEAEMNRIIASRKTDGRLAIASPLTGRIVARSAAPGLLAQPGGMPAPVTVADLSSVWMIANVPEYLLPSLHPGASVSVSLMAWPGRRFEGRIANIGASIDPATHTVAVRSEIPDPRHELLPQMLATFTLHSGEPMQSPALPQNGVVREGDGTMVVFVTRDGLSFERRPVQTGMTQNGQQQILDGLAPGEKVATDGALFLSNALALSAR